MLEEEARKLICPFLQLQDRTHNKTSNECVKAPYCITSECMAWETTKGDIMDKKTFNLSETGEFRTKDEFIEYHTLNNYEEEAPLEFIMRKDEECGYCKRLQ